MTELRPSRSALVRGLAVGAVAIALVIAGSLLAWRAVGPSRVQTEIGRVSFQVLPSLSGQASAFVPLADWGFRADAFDAPFELRAELRSLDRSAITRAADGDRSVLDRAEDDLADGGRRALLRAALAGIAVSIALLGVATVLWRRLRPRWVLLATGSALALVGYAAALAAAQRSFNAGAFAQPTYFARGAEMQRILEVAGGQPVGSEYGETLASVLRSVNSVLTQAPARDSAPGTDLFVASDFHANALVVDPLSRFIGDVPLLLVGDYGQRGGAGESALLAPQVAALGSRSVAVSGNHDTSRLMGSLAANGVSVLGENEGARVDTSTIDGLRVAGFADPLEWRGAGDPASRPVTFDDLPDPVAAFETASNALVRGFDALPRPPAVAMVHQNGLAQRLARTLHERGYERPLTIVTGHDHRQHVDRYGSIVVVDGGSVGAGGVFDAGRAAIGFAQLHFGGDRARLRSVDLVAIEPFAGDARASHVNVDSLCGGEPVCSFDAPSPIAPPPD